VAEGALVVGGARQVHRRHAQHDHAPTAGAQKRSTFPAAPRFRSCLPRRKSRPERDARRTRGPSRRPVMPADYTGPHFECIGVGLDRCGVDNREPDVRGACREGVRECEYIDDPMWGPSSGMV
jgi:hypothetical protein